jgi:hypothetical protein
MEFNTIPRYTIKCIFNAYNNQSIKTKNTMKKALLLALVPLLMATTCNKKEKEYPTYYMDQEFKDYTLFKVGSYWVYQDSASKQIDSVYLYKQEITINDRRKAVNYNYEQFTENLKSSLYDTLVGEGLKLSESGGFVYGILRLNDFTNYASSYFQTPTIGELDPLYRIIKYQTYRNDTTISNKNYTQVKVFEANQQSFSYQSHKIFYSKHLGLVRKELFNGEVWNLIRHHVTQ